MNRDRNKNRNKNNLKFEDGDTDECPGLPSGARVRIKIRKITING